MGTILWLFIRRYYPNNDSLYINLSIKFNLLAIVLTPLLVASVGYRHADDGMEEIPSIGQIDPLLCRFSLTLLETNIQPFLQLG
jgi:hypothetical protein